MSDDSFSQRLRTRVRTTDDWQAQHRAHLDRPDRAFDRELFPHPSGTWFWLVCPCGARHLTETGFEE